MSLLFWSSTGGGGSLVLLAEWLVRKAHNFDINDNCHTFCQFADQSTTMIFPNIDWDQWCIDDQSFDDQIKLNWLIHLWDQFYLGQIRCAVLLNIKILRMRSLSIVFLWDFLLDGMKNIIALWEQNFRLQLVSILVFFTILSSIIRLTLKHDNYFTW